VSGDREHPEPNRGAGQRDEILGAALRRLEIPEHRPGFHAELRANLGTAAHGPDTAGREHPARPSRAPSPRRRARHRLRWTLGLAAAAAVALFLVIVNLPGTSPGTASAAEVRAAVAKAWASARDIGGVLIVNYRHPVVPSQQNEQARFLLTARGDFRLTWLDQPGAVAYDATTNVERSLTTSASMPGSTQLFASELTGLAPGPPDPGPSSSLLDLNLGSVVRALAASRGGQVREVTYQGRPAWLLDTSVRPSAAQTSAALLPDHLQLTVDRQTGFPVRVVVSRDGRTLYQTRLEDLTVNPPVPEHAFSLTFPPGKQVSRTDFGFRRVALDNARRIVGYAPLVPASIPHGYHLSEIMVSRKPSPAVNNNPPAGDIVSLSYRRGLGQFIVTTRPAGSHPRAWHDPMGTGGGYAQRPERVTFSSGALAGREGHLVISPFAAPHVWALTGKLVVTVSGDLSRAELMQVAGSLR
jgi:hypothetical protein